MNSLLLGIGVGFFISLIGLGMVQSSMGQYSYSYGGIFLGAILLAIGGIISLIHTIAAGVKLGNDLSKK